MNRHSMSPSNREVHRVPEETIADNQRDWGNNIDSKVSLILFSFTKGPKVANPIIKINRRF